jgi:ferredoxin
MLEPELFPLDDVGYSALEAADVDATDTERVRRAVASCPERALSVTDS